MSIGCSLSSLPQYQSTIGKCFIRRPGCGVITFSTMLPCHNRRCIVLVSFAQDATLLFTSASLTSRPAPQPRLQMMAFASRAGSLVDVSSPAPRHDSTSVLCGETEDTTCKNHEWSELAVRLRAPLHVKWFPPYFSPTLDVFLPVSVTQRCATVSQETHTTTDLASMEQMRCCRQPSFSQHILRGARSCVQPDNPLKILPECCPFRL